MLLARARCLLRATTVLLLSVQADAAFAQGASPLSTAERSRAVEIETAARSSGRAAAPAAAPSASDRRPTRLATAPASADGKSVVTSVVPLDPAPSTPASGRAAAAPSAASAPRLAEVTRFDYATGATVRSTINLGSGQVLNVRSKVNATTPLAPEELEEAKRLFLAAVPNANDSLRAAGQGRDPFVHLIPTTPHPSIPRYGHRLIHMWIAGPQPTEQYFVDLTTREVVKKR